MSPIDSDETIFRLSVEVELALKERDKARIRCAELGNPNSWRIISFPGYRSQRVCR